MNAEAKVIGVVVSGLRDGQGLNFAVPAAAITALLSSVSPSLEGILRDAAAVKLDRQRIKYSADERSEWQRAWRREEGLLRSALPLAKSSDDFLRIFEAAFETDYDVASRAAANALRLSKAPTARHYAAVAKAEQRVAWGKEGPAKATVLKEAVEAAKKAVGVRSDLPNIFLLADVLEDAGQHAAAYLNFEKVATGNAGDLRIPAIRGLTRTARALMRNADAIAWFDTLEKAGEANDFDKFEHAKFLSETGAFASAAALYETLAVNGAQVLTTQSELWEKAVVAWYSADDDDAALRAARRGIASGAKERGSENEVATMHVLIAIVLNNRGVYDEAIDAARQAITLDPERGRAYEELAEGLLGAQRPAEAETAAKRAVALADGNSGDAHFHLGAAYFDQKKYALAVQSFEQASRLKPKDSGSAYNAGLASERDGFYVDAIRWYEEALRRNPQMKGAAETRARIERLRRR